VAQVTGRRWLTALLAVVLLAGCSLFGASEITVEARNESDRRMVVQVVEGAGGDGGAYGPAHTLEPLEERTLELAVPGGGWTVTVNEARLIGSSDAADRRGRLPVTLIVPAIDDPIPGPYWEAPADWAQTGPP
jgi:hypothetical protein